MREPMTLVEIAAAAPATPACFYNRSAWLSYLADWQAGKTEASRPFKSGRFDPGFSHCRDCTRSHQVAMSQQSKCNPHQFQQQEEVPCSNA